MVHVNLDTDAYRLAKAAAANEERSLRVVLKRAIENYVAAETQAEAVSDGIA